MQYNTTNTYSFGGTELFSSFIGGGWQESWDFQDNSIIFNPGDIIVLTIDGLGQYSSAGYASSQFLELP